MSEKFNPADKLNLPEPPEGTFWKVIECYGHPEMHLCRKKKFFKWEFGWTDYRTYGPVRGTYCVASWPNKEETSLEEELILCAETVLDRLEKHNKKYKELNALYDNKMYLDNLIDTTNAPNLQGR